jgi:hypothetical protein
VADGTIAFGDGGAIVALLRACQINSRFVREESAVAGAFVQWMLFRFSHVNGVEILRLLKQVLEMNLKE